MNALLSLYASARDFWSKLAPLLPKVGGAGMLLIGVGGYLVEISHAASVGDLLVIAQGFKSDGNLALIMSGLALLGLDAQHQTTKAALAAMTAPKA